MIDSKAAIAELGVTPVQITAITEPIVTDNQKIKIEMNDQGHHLARRELKARCVRLHSNGWLITIHAILTTKPINGALIPPPTKNSAIDDISSKTPGNGPSYFFIVNSVAQTKRLRA